MWRDYVSTFHLSRYVLMYTVILGISIRMPFSFGMGERLDEIVYPGGCFKPPHVKGIG
jgi:hypothetical protein